MGDLFNIQAEAALLGAMLIDSEIAARVCSRLQPDDFAFPAHFVIFQRLAEQIERGSKVSPLTLRPMLDDHPVMQPIGGVRYLAQLTADGSGLLAPAELVTQLLDLAARRRAVAALQNVDVSLDDVEEQIRLHNAGTTSTKLLPLLTGEQLASDPSPRQSLWSDWLPLRQTTLLTGEGGVGKSLLAQQLATCVALGLDCLGRRTTPRRALYVTVEDDPEELHRRQVAICEALGVRIAELEGNLYLSSLAGDDAAALAQLSASGRLAATDRWRSLRSLSQAEGIGLAVLDNGTDLLAADHNDLHTVARFVNLLTGWAIEQDGAVLLLHHPAKGGADWLGSVAWTNKVRNRLLIKRDDGPDPDSRVIESMKANYGRTGDRIACRWHAGAFVLDDDLPESVRAQLDEVTGANAANDAFLRCLDVCTEQRRNVSHQSASNYAPREFVRMVEGKGWTVDDFRSAMERLAHLGLIEFDAELWVDNYRRPKRGIRRREQVR